MKPTVISTFAGAGGSSLGYAQAGFKERLAVEWDPHAVETFRRHFPDVDVFHGDIAELSVDECLARAGLERGALDVFDGSPPCQGFSMAGRRHLADPRNQLFREFVRLLDGLQPKVFVMENVAGMVQGKMKLIFAEILSTLKSTGYRVSARLLDAQYYGVAQTRRRMIFIGVREDLGIDPSHPPAQGYPVAIREVIADLVDHPPDEAIGHIWYSDEERQTKTYAKAFRAHQGQKFAGQQCRHRWDRPCGTLQTPGGKATIPGTLRNIGCHPLRTRTFSIREYARLSSFPDAFQVQNHLCYGYRQIGNCVPPKFMEAIAAHIRRTLLEA